MNRLKFGRENNHVESFVDVPKRLKSPLTVLFAKVLRNQSGTPVETKNQPERQRSLVNVPRVFDPVKRDEHLIYCTHIKYGYRQLIALICQPSVRWLTSSLPSSRQRLSSPRAWRPPAAHPDSFRFRP